MHPQTEMRQEPSNIARGSREWTTAALVLLVLDLFWLGICARGFYSEHLGALLRPEANRTAAALFYVFYVTVIWATSIRGSETWTQAWRRGAILGFVCYGVYELTNWAVLTGWPAIVVPVDWTWGIFLTGTAAGAGRYSSQAGRES